MSTTIYKAATQTTLMGGYNIDRYNQVLGIVEDVKVIWGPYKNTGTFNSSYDYEGVLRVWVDGEFYFIAMVEPTQNSYIITLQIDMMPHLLQDTTSTYHITQRRVMWDDMYTNVTINDKAPYRLSGIQWASTGTYDFNLGKFIVVGNITGTDVANVPPSQNNKIVSANTHFLVSGSKLASHSATIKYREAQKSIRLNYPILAYPQNPNSTPWVQGGSTATISLKEAVTQRVELVGAGSTMQLPYQAIQSNVTSPSIIMNGFGLPLTPQNSNWIGITGTTDGQWSTNYYYHVAALNHMTTITLNNDGSIAMDTNEDLPLYVQVIVWQMGKRWVNNSWVEAPEILADSGVVDFYDEDNKFSNNYTLTTHSSSPEYSSASPQELINQMGKDGIQVLSAGYVPLSDITARTITIKEHEYNIVDTYPEVVQMEIAAYELPKTLSPYVLSIMGQRYELDSNLLAYSDNPWDTVATIRINCIVMDSNVITKVYFASGGYDGRWTYYSNSQDNGVGFSVDALTTYMLSNSQVYAMQALQAQQAQDRLNLQQQQRIDQSNHNYMQGLARDMTSPLQSLAQGDLFGALKGIGKMNPLGNAISKGIDLSYEQLDNAFTSGQEQATLNQQVAQGKAMFDLQMKNIAMSPDTTKPSNEGIVALQPHENVIAIYMTERLNSSLWAQNIAMFGYGGLSELRKGFPPLIDDGQYVVGKLIQTDIPWHRIDACNNILKGTLLYSKTFVPVKPTPPLPMPVEVRAIHLNCTTSQLSLYNQQLFPNTYLENEETDNQWDYTYPETDPENWTLIYNNIGNKVMTVINHDQGTTQNNIDIDTNGVLARGGTFIVRANRSNPQDYVVCDTDLNNLFIMLNTTTQKGLYVLYVNGTILLDEYHDSDLTIPYTLTGDLQGGIVEFEDGSVFKIPSSPENMCQFTM